jgi:hypothetical protein
MLAAGVAGALVALALGGSAGAAPQTVTIGSVSPDGASMTNFPSCSGSTHCTYIPYADATPELTVPFDGTVTSFSLNSNANGKPVELRVLRPTGPGAYTAVRSSPDETPTQAGVNTFAVSLAVNAGDVLGLDDQSDRLMFAAPDSPYLTFYYNPALADNSTLAPSGNTSGYKLLLEATVVQSTTTTTTTGTTGTTTNTNPQTPPQLTNVRQSHRRWREGTKLAKFASGTQAPVGTTFRFNLSESATLQFVFRQQRCGHRCAHGALNYSAAAGARKLTFQGRISHKKRLRPGRYKLTITAFSAGLTSTPQTLRFTIVRS